MAKLNVVIPAADVEVIGKDGARTKYRKVERKAQEGDIVRITSGGYASVEWGAFYPIEDGAKYSNPGVVSIVDDDGDFRWGPLSNGKDWDVYEKVTEPAASIPDEVAFEGTKYRRVVRSAEEGDVIKITELADEDDAITMGGLYRVESLDWAGDPQITDDDGEDFDTVGTSYEVYERVADQHRTVTEPTQYGVGDYVKVVRHGGGGHNYEIGAVVKVVQMDGNILFYAEKPDGKTGNLLAARQVEPATEAEFLAQKMQDRLKVGDYAKVIADQTSSDDDPISSGARIGDVVEVIKNDGSRIPFLVKTIEGANVGDNNWAREWALEYVDKAEFLAQKAFKVGDYVKVTDASGASGIAKVGDIGEVTNENWSGGPIGDQTIIEIETLDGREYGMYAHRFVRATEAEVEAAKQALKYGDFTDGDYAQIVNATEDNASTVAIEYAGSFVRVTRDIDGYRGLALRLPSGIFAGYANADALRKVTREEYEAAVDPRSKFAKGDKVRLISGGQGSGLFGFNTGEIYEVTDPKTSDWESKRIQIGNRFNLGFALPDQLEKVSAEEIAEIERKQAEEEAKRREDSKWTAIGRKVDEFKVGDIVECTGSTCGHPIGTVGEIVYDENSFAKLRVKANGIIKSHIGQMRLIVPVEQRFDREQVETAQAA